MNTEPAIIISAVVEMCAALISDSTIFLLDMRKEPPYDLHLTLCRAHLNIIVKACHRLINPKGFTNHFIVLDACRFLSILALSLVGNGINDTDALCHCLLCSIEAVEPPA